MKCLYVVALMALFWVTEVMPLPVTGMIPVVLYPLMSIMSTNDTCLCYMNDTTMMFLGSLVIAVVIENSGLHMRMALLIIKTIGCSHRRYFPSFSFYRVIHYNVFNFLNSLVRLVVEYQYIRNAIWYNIELYFHVLSRPVQDKFHIIFHL